MSNPSLTERLEQLVKQWRANAEATDVCAREPRHSEQGSSNLAHLAAQLELCADQLAAALGAPQAQERELMGALERLLMNQPDEHGNYTHLLICNFDRRKSVTQARCNCPISQALPERPQPQELLKKIDSTIEFCEQSGRDATVNLKHLREIRQALTGPPPQEEKP